MTDAFASIESTPQGDILALKGSWLVGNVSFVDRWIQKCFVNPAQVKSIDAEAITQMDTAGAYLLYEIQKKININIQITGLKDNFNDLLQLVSSELSQLNEKKIIPVRHDFFYIIG